MSSGLYKNTAATNKNLIYYLLQQNLHNEKHSVTEMKQLLTISQQWLADGHAQI